MKKKNYKQLEAYAKMLDNELEKGRQIQRSFLPDQPLKIPGWESAAFFKSAYQVAGDFYDVFELPCRCVGIVVADVCDKGVGAAIFMALFRSLLRIFSGHAALKGFTIEGTELQCGESISAYEQPPTAAYPPRVLKAVQLTNDYVASYHGDLGMFATVFFAVLYPVNGSLTYINAGHDPQYIITPSGGVKAQLDPTGPAVGIYQQSGLVLSKLFWSLVKLCWGTLTALPKPAARRENFSLPKDCLHC
jgi:serine phosphatase RsbU (regulator of sigma subunit)